MANAMDTIAASIPINEIITKIPFLLYMYVLSGPFPALPQVRKGPQATRGRLGT